jgi:hypothetical protein
MTSTGLRQLPIISENRRQGMLLCRCMQIRPIHKHLLYRSSTLMPLPFYCSGTADGSKRFQPTLERPEPPVKFTFPTPGDIGVFGA